MGRGRLFVIFFLLLILSIAVLFVAGVDFYRVDQNSMSPTLQSGNRIMVDRIGPRIFGIKRGDIVVYQLDDDNLVIKRCFLSEKDDIITTPRSIINRNGDELYTDYQRLNIKNRDKVPKGHYFFVGDNNTISNDSRNYGFVKRDKIIGRVIAWSNY